MAHKTVHVPAFWQSLVMAALMSVTAWVAHAFTPTLHLSDVKTKIDLANQIPKSFGDWQEDSTIVPILPNPQVQAKLDALYSSTLARTYRNSSGQRVMLSVAYGSDQSSEATAVHRPEFCYSAQGFKVSNLGIFVENIGNRHINVQRLSADLGLRHEIITYWITMDETTTLPGIERKYQQLRYGLKGQIPDGLLFRISSLGRSEADSFNLQDKFLNDLSGFMDPDILNRYFGV